MFKLKITSVTCQKPSKHYMLNYITEIISKPNNRFICFIISNLILNLPGAFFHLSHAEVTKAFVNLHKFRDLGATLDPIYS